MGRRLLLLTEDVEQLKNGLSELQVGDHFTFGDYHGPIEWRVLDKTQDTLFVISEYALDTKHFDKEGKTNDWDKCSLKKWLNSEFFNQAFDSEEKSLIENTSFGKVFCLSKEEAKRYFKGESDRKAPGKWWWLRSHNIYDSDTARVYSVGVDYNGHVHNAFFSVRPAMKLKI